MDCRVLSIAESLKKLRVGETRYRTYKNFGTVAVRRMENAAEITFEGELVMVSENPVWELYLAEALILPERSRGALKHIASACFVKSDCGLIKVSDKGFFVDCLLQRKNPLLSAVLEGGVNAKDV